MLWINLGSSVKKNWFKILYVGTKSIHTFFKRNNTSLSASCCQTLPCLCKCSVKRANGFYLQFLATLRTVANVIKMASQRCLSQNLLNMPEFVLLVLCMLKKNCLITNNV